MPLSEDAAAAFDRWRIRHDAKAKAASGLQSDAFGKQPGLSLRIALIMEHLFWAAPEEGAEPAGISLAAVDRAIRLIDGWVTPHLDRVLADAGTPKADTRATALARWLLKQRLARFNASHLRRLSFQHLAGLRLAKDMDEACAKLADAGWIRPAGVRAGAAKAARARTSRSIRGFMKYRERRQIRSISADR